MFFVIQQTQTNNKNTTANKIGWLDVGFWLCFVLFCFWFRLTSPFPFFMFLSRFKKINPKQNQHAKSRSSPGRLEF
jgi:hypothetical protein